MDKQEYMNCKTCKKNICPNYTGHQWHYNGKVYCEHQVRKIKVQLTPEQEERADRIIKHMKTGKL